MKKFILLAIFSVLTFTTYAQGCNQYINSSLCPQQSKTVGGYTIYYKMCPDGIFIDSFTFSDTTKGAKPELNFTNIVIPSMLDIQDGLDVYFPGSCVAWGITASNAVMVPIPGKPGWFQTEGVMHTYALIDCSGKGCCKWSKMGDGILEDDFGLANESQICKTITQDVPLRPGQTMEVQCFPLCSQMKKMVWSPIKGEVPITLSPNPATNYIQLSHITNIASIVIYDNIGRIVYSREASSNLIDIAKFQKGTYFMQLNRTDGMIEAKNFIKQ
jgi:hypothetical protein